MEVFTDDHMCFCCGKKNMDGMRLDFVIDDQKHIHTEFTFPKKFQGYADVVHGGMIGMVLDEVMVNLPWRVEQVPVVSAEVTFRLKKPVRVGQKIIFKAWVVKHLRRFYEVESTAELEDGTLVAEGHAKCFRIEAKIG